MGAINEVIDDHYHSYVFNEPQTQAVKEQSYIPDESKIEHVQALPNFEQSMATLDMAEFARRH